MSRTLQNEPWRGIGDDWEVLPGVAGGELLKSLEEMGETDRARWWKRNPQRMTAITPSLLNHMAATRPPLASAWARLAQGEHGADSALLTMIQMVGGVEAFMNASVVPQGMILVKYWAKSRPSITTPIGVMMLKAMLERSSEAGNLAQAVSLCRDVDDEAAIECAKRLSAKNLEVLSQGPARGAQVALQLLKRHEGRTDRLAGVLRWPQARASRRVRAEMLANFNKLSLDRWRSIFDTLDGEADFAFAIEAIWGLLDLEARDPSLVDPEVAAYLEGYLEKIYQERLSAGVLDCLSESDSGPVRQRAILEIVPRLPAQGEEADRVDGIDRSDRAPVGVQRSKGFASGI